MTNISLNNGGTVLIGSVADALEVIDEKLSYELADYIRCTISDFEAEAQEQTDEARFWENHFDECKRKITELETENIRLLDELSKLKKKENKAEISDDVALPFF